MSLPQVAAVIFSSRESPDTLLGAMSAAAADPALHGGVLDVVVNGNRELAEACSVRLGKGAMDDPAVLVRFWFLPLGDKSHAWNTYVHELWPDAACTVFIDGYVRVARGALGMLHQGLTDAPEALAVTGVPTVGHSAAKLRQEMVSSGGIHGNLYALGRTAMELVRGERFRLPLGLYRTDSLLGAALLFRLAPDSDTWDPRRIKVLPDATWQFDPLRWWRAGDLVTQGWRLLRQSQGRLENLAVRHQLCSAKLKPSALSRTAAQMVDAWVEACPVEAGSAMRWSPLLDHALRRLRRPRDWSSADVPAKLLWQSGRTPSTDNLHTRALAPAPSR